MEQVTDFKSFGLSAPVLKALDKMGFAEPTPIQKKALPLILDGKDLVGQAQTGTGKTAVFGIPMAQRLPADGSHVRAITLCPTRELAVQVAEEIHEISYFTEHKVLPVYGGQRIDRQINALRKGVDLVVGTPGRILDHLGRGTLNLSKVEILVLDEADMMLDMGFLPDIRRIISRCPKKRQTMLFSATIPEGIRRIASDYMIDATSVSVVPETLTLEDTDQIFYEVPEEEKVEALTRVLDFEKEGSSAIIFCRTRRNVDKVTRKLKARGYDAEGLHGDMAQPVRDRTMRGFRDGKFSFLVATDVASRGLDISHVTHVINYHVPQDPEAYVHRVGRTGRMGRSGVAITLVTPAEYWDLVRVQEFSNVHIEEGELPSNAEVKERRRAARGDEAARERVKTADREGPKPRAKEKKTEEEKVKVPAAETKAAQGFGRPEPTEAPSTEEERRHQEYISRDAEKRIEWASTEKVVEEAARIEHDDLVELARAHGDPGTDAPAAEGGAGTAEGSAVVPEQEERRRRDLMERISEAERLVAEKGALASSGQGVQEEEAEPLLDAKEEERIKKALGLRDRLLSMARGLDDSELDDYSAVIDRLEQEFDLRRITATLLKAFGREKGEPIPQISEEAPTEQAADDRMEQDGGGEMTRLFISVGRNSKVNKEDLERLVREAAGISENDVGRIDLLHRFAFIEVRKKVAEQVIDTMHESIFRGREISVEPARSKR